MAKNILPVDFQDDILNESMNNKRRYRMITNQDGTVSFEDVTDYDQIGSNFGQAQINATNEAVNESADKNRIIDNQDDLMANVQEGMIAGALAVKEIKDELNGNINSSIVLWENPDPTASFAAQDIELISADYDTYEVFYTSRTTGTLQSQKSIKGYGVTLLGLLAATSSAVVFIRPIKYTSDTKFTVSKASYSTSSGGPTTTNEYLVPIRIVGYK